MPRVFENILPLIRLLRANEITEGKVKVRDDPPRFMEHDKTCISNELFVDVICLDGIITVFSASTWAHCAFMRTML